MSPEAELAVGGILTAAAFTLMIAIIWFRWKFWEDRP